MKTKEDIFNELQILFKQNSISIYYLAKITKINRSTLQKAFNGTRALKPRQFKKIVSCLPIAPAEQNKLYSDFIKATWTDEQIENNDLILGILETISETIKNNVLLALPTNLDNIVIDKNIYKGKDLPNVIKYLTILELQKKAPRFYTFMPFTTNFFNENIGQYINSYGKDAKASILFEFSKSLANYNLKTLSNLIPAIIDVKNTYELHYIYVDDNNINNHLTIYPYYVIMSDKVLLLNAELNEVAIINDIDVVQSILNGHMDKLKYANTLIRDISPFPDNLEFFMKNQSYSEYIYSIAYGPCTSSFVPPEMYTYLISDEFPLKAKMLKLISERLTQIYSVPNIHELFSVQGLDEFVNEGHILYFKHPLLKPCTPAQRKIILTNILKAIESKKLSFIAYEDYNIKVISQYELPETQNHHSFNIVLYSDDYYTKNININEPIISKCFINFINDISDTDLTYSQEETVELINERIAILDDMIIRGE